MTWASCITAIEQALRSTSGVLSGHASLETEEAVASAGYEIADRPAPVGLAAVDRESEERDREYRSLMRQWWFGAAVGTCTMIMSYPWLFPGLGRGNSGAEGPTEDPAILTLRERRVRTFLATLFISQGVPMLCGGDEMGRTQHGNNNAYCPTDPGPARPRRAAASEVLPKAGPCARPT